ncbi:MAG TPA: ABC transporter permease [Virgibacillus sp.]|nr:ABC transporter permease [Virgibacillus sp.]
MRNTWKVAKWEIKRNMKNKSFVIGLLITPLIFLFFMIVPGLFGDSEPEVITVFVKDDIHILDEIEQSVEQNPPVNWIIEETDSDLNGMEDRLKTEENIAYMDLTEENMNEGVITVHTSDDMDEDFLFQTHILEDPILKSQLEQLGLTEEERAMIEQGIAFEVEEITEVGVNDEKESAADPLERIIPGAFAGIVLFSIVITGMMIFQSASQEKKDKIAEIILSSVLPSELMQGKIIGYFVIGLIQVFVWIGISLPAVLWKFDIPIFEHLFVPELAILLFIAVLGYLLFASIFVGLGATMEDISTSGNFQGMVLMLPFLPFIFLGPILNDPSGLIAKIGTYIPFTSPGVLLIRLSMLEEWPWLEIILAIVILIISVWVFIKIAGKVFKTGILMYGKNATPKEIWKWLRA